MSAFSPSNIVEDPSSKKDLEEDYTKEIEIETAFKTFQEAITLQNRKRYVEAYEKYKLLQKKDVIYNHYYEESEFVKGLQNGSSNARPDELSYLSQNVKTIRFLYFRNRGFLYFHILRCGDDLIEQVLQKDQSLPDAQEITRPELARELFYSMIDDFINCFVYSEVDETLLRLLYDLFTYLGLTRLARFTLEYTLSLGQESEDVVSVLPMNEWAKPVWEDFQNRGLTGDSIPPHLSEKLAFLAPMRLEFASSSSKRLEKKSLVVTVKPQSCWADVFHSFNHALKHAQDKDKQQAYLRYASLKCIDPYVASDVALDRTSYAFPTPESEPTPIVEVSAETAVEEVKEETQPMAVDDVQVLEPNPSTTPTVPTSSESLLDNKAVQRSSRRLNREENVVFEAEDIQLTRHYYVETEAFFKMLNTSLMNAFHCESDILHDVVCHIVDADEVSTSPLFVQDFVRTLNEWKTPLYTSILLSKKKGGVNKNESDADKLKLLDVLTQFGDQRSSNAEAAVELLDDAQDYDFIKAALESASSNKHPISARVHILSLLLGGETPTILAYYWSAQLTGHVIEWIFQLGNNIFDKLYTEDPASNEFRQIIQICVSIYEIFVDSYISIKKKLEKYLGSQPESGIGKGLKQTLNALALDLLSYEERLRSQCEAIEKRWYQSLNIAELSREDATLLARFIWSYNYLLSSQSFTWKEKKFVVLHLKNLNSVFAQYPDLSITFPNYKCIGNLNQESYERRLTTSSILSIFSKILWSEKSAKGGSQETIALLENILIDQDLKSSGNENENDGSLISSVIHGTANLDKASLSSVSEFLDVCPIDLKLNLWSILFSYYKDTGMFDSFQRGFEQNVRFMLSYLKSSKYSEEKQNRSVILLNTLNYFGGNLRIFLKYLATNNWSLPIRDPANSLKAVQELAQLFELFYCFSLHEESALITGAKFSLEQRSKKAFQRFKDFCIETITIILVYAINQIKSEGENEQAIGDLLLLVHNQLGIRRLCDSSYGIFLKLAEDTLVVFNERPDYELSQLLSCRFHYKVKIKDRFPADHGTVKTADLDRRSAKELAKFILPLCFRHNPLLKVPRNDMKQVVDDIFEVLKELDIDSDKILVQNNSRIESYYQNAIIDARFIKRAFYGLHDLSFQKPTKDDTVASRGLYFVEAIFMFNSYKIRKKSAQSRTVELEKIIRLLKDDLICGSDRVESWILLGQAYGYIVEDDLIWTSDKLNIIERKVITANIQRQSLLSFIMAVNVLTRKGQAEAEHYQPVIGVLMNSFVKEMYSACRSPLDMIAFKTQANAKFVKKRHITMMQPVADQPTLTNNFCFKLMSQCLHLAIRSNKDDWSSYYYLAKLQRKLGKPALEILNTIAKCSKIAFTQGTTSDPILEPSYSLCSWIYKFYKAGKLSLDQASFYLKKDKFLRVSSTILLMKPEDLYWLLIVCLKTLIVLDRKGWYHKQCFRMASIYYNEFDDFKEARSIMSKFFSLKATNKTYLQMWKPEHERPGKHFVYMYQYTEFYIKLLRRDLDLTSLALLLPKLRRANSTMIKLYFAWENICSSICKLIRIIAQVEDGSTEKFLFMKPHQSFVYQAKLLNETMKGQNIPESLKAHICYLYLINDMRKLNNGFGPTSLIDDTLCSVYLRIFNDQVERFNISEKEAPSKDASAVVKEPTKVKRLARRDLFPFIGGLVTTVKRDVESLFKDSPDVFNEFVKSYIEERKDQIKAQELMALSNIGKGSTATPSPALLPASIIHEAGVASSNPVQIAPSNPATSSTIGLPSTGSGSVETIAGSVQADFRVIPSTPKPPTEVVNEEHLTATSKTLTAPSPGRTGPRAGIIKKSSIDAEIERSFQAQTAIKNDKKSNGDAGVNKSGEDLNEAPNSNVKDKPPVSVPSGDVPLDSSEAIAVSPLAVTEAEQPRDTVMIDPEPRSTTPQAAKPGPEPSEQPSKIDNVESARIEDVEEVRGEDPEVSATKRHVDSPESDSKRSKTGEIEQ